MNVLVLDPERQLSDAELASHCTHLGFTGVVCRATMTGGPANGPAHWVFTFQNTLTAVPPLKTRTPPDGLACAVLLTTDQFVSEEPLLILGSDAPDWGVHLARLAAAAPRELDVFLSFTGDGPPRREIDPDLTALLRRTGGVSPALAWYRTATLFYEAAKQVIRKDARWGGRYTADSVLRELALHDARVGYHGTPWEMHAPAS